MAEVPLPTPTDNPVPSTDIRDAVYAGAMLDKVVTSTDLTYTDRLGGEHYTVDGIKAEGDKVVEETRQNLIPLSRQYMTLAAAQADIANIPEGSTTYVRSTDGSALADEYINNGGTLSKTGRSMQSSAYTDSIFDPLSEAVNANFNSLVAVLTENMALKETVTATGQLNSDKNSVLLLKSGSLVFGGNVPASISAVSDDNKTIFSRKIYPGESFANGVWRTPYRDYTFKASPDEISSVTIGDTVTIIVMLSALTPDAWFDGSSNTVFSDGFTTMSQGAQAGASVNSVAGGDGGTVRFGVLNSDITGAGYELTAAGVTGYFANTFNNIAVYYRAVAPSLYIDTEISGVFNGLATVTIESPATAVIEQYTYPEKEVMAPATPVGVYNADIKNITGRSLTGVPSEVAIQFSPGEVSTQAALRLTDENGTEYPCQFAGDMDANLRRESDIARYVDNSFNTGKIIFFADIPANTSRKFRLETYGARGKTAAEWNYPKLTRNLTTDRWEITVGDFTWEFLTSTGALASVRKGDASIGVSTLRRIVAVTDGAAVENTNIDHYSLRLISAGPVFAEVEQTSYHAAQGGVQAGDVKSVTRYRLFNTGAIYIYNVFRAEREIPANNLYGVRLDVQLSGGSGASYTTPAGAAIATNVPFEGHTTWNLVNEFVISDALRDTISNENTWGAIRPYPSVLMLVQGTALRARSGWLFTSLANNNLLNYVTPKGWTWPAGHWLFPYSVGAAENTISNSVLNRPCGVFYRSTPTHVLRQRIYQQLERLMDGVFDLYTNEENGQISATDYSGYRYPQVYGLYDALRNGEDFDTRYGYFKTFITDKIGSYSNAGNAYLTGAWTLQFSGRMCFAAVEMYYRYAQKINNTAVMDDLKIFIASACDGLATKIEANGAAPLGGNENIKGPANSNMEAYRMLAIGIYAGLDTSGRYQAAINTLVNMMKTNSYATHAYPTLMDTFDAYPFLNRWLSYECHGYYVYLRACRLLNTTPEFDNSNYLMRAMQGNGTPEYLTFTRAEDRRGFCETPGATAIGLLMQGSVSGTNAAALLLDKFERDWSMDPIAQPHLCDFRQLTTPLTTAYEGFEHVVNQFALILLDRKIG
ncbi:hypothetical protein RZQ35_04560 [Klebsiella quasipneumoniae subsp. quasipneumoniae]|uniref:hypothetical protein n=1 Tax=Klebsiella quasipneumoniae TaxID=1463165 RepID=UPI00292A8B4D|nr:hypothetical protein [Klebsiella quasipneumoniae]MDV1504820.1 hypothetical protein [Klebsiella quasipneumoniae subsp. quasipneumoniae]MDV1519712.1 hypothetical protein [Klebsiella quasipneumoniae subsp. quasipneumoniae]MDV1556869.1 hypothetical protein [Klebsiella quasipneumoniae subsp. quasipneumoniae]MDV1579436.1 hypothetical protein [Klebsiella quasipneumoniae subsp. quasipneumoniae]MDW2622933.1 hypothetical protein [Klebsiella quasipneumoniae]